MNAKKHMWIIGLVASSLLLAGCNDAPAVPTQTAPIVKPALTEMVAANQTDSLSFNGVVRATERADLSFRIDGLIDNIYVNEGDAVKKGQLLARLDSRDAKTALASAKLELANVEVEYQRANAIYKKSKAISKSQLDEITTRFNLAKNRRDEAQRKLDYTKITAPFSGVIGRKFVDNHVQIKANTPVFTLHDLSDLEVVISIPDSVMLSGVAANKAQAQVSGIDNQVFDLSLKTYATEADPISQTYAVVLGFNDLQGFRILPGMTVKVIPVENKTRTQNTTITLPVIAVVPDNQGKKYVWVVNKDNKVEQRFVEVGPLSGERVVITNNLQLGEQVVVAGMSSLREGMEIRPIQNNSEGQ